MIAYIEGKIDRLSPTNALLDVGGVGYDINITLTDYTALQGKPSARLWITEIIREDAHLLYGFVREESRAFFEKLCSVSGVGPSTARLILSSYTPNDLASIIGNGAVDLLKNVKGIGLKTAQRIVVDLKGKIDLSAYDLSEGMPEGGNAPEVAAVSDEAQRALKMLGFPEAAIRKVVKAVLGADAHLPVEEVIKQALKRL
ncbi:Holliday junction branch migration protein RuvA [Porphyromonas endodontalis]